MQRLVAISTFADDPRYSQLQALPQTIRGRVGGEPESLVALKPDLVILAAYNRPELIRMLGVFGVKTLVQERFDSFADIATNILAIGQAIHTEAAAEDVVTLLRDKVRFEFSPCPLTTVLLFTGTGHVVGGGTLLDESITRAGGINIARRLGVNGWQVLQAEVFAPLDPDVILASGTEEERSRIVESIAASPGYRSIAARGRYRLILVRSPLMASVSHHAGTLVPLLRREFRTLRHK
jgi:iron complex transport system substrate-binding protein